MLFVIILKVASFGIARISPNRAHIDHAIPELDKGTAHDRNVQIRNVLQDELCKLLIFLLPNPLDEAVPGQRFSQTVRGQSIFGKAEVEERCDRQ